MHFNIYVDDETGERLAELAREAGKSRNAVIREAIAAWVERNRHGWPQEILEFDGIRGAPRFEDYRDELKEPAEDPLA